MLTIEKVDYSHLIGDPSLRDGVGEFRMKVTYPGGKKPYVRFTNREFRDHRISLAQTPTRPRSFVIGAFKAFFDQKLKQLPEEYKALIEAVHQALNDLEIDTYSCFQREKYGKRRMRSRHATILDGLALRQSDFLTMLPGASVSRGTWKEITYATQNGTDLICLFREANPELEFRQRIMESAVVHGGGSMLTFITFGNYEEIGLGLAITTASIRERIAQ